MLLLVSAGAALCWGSALCAVSIFFVFSFELSPLEKVMLTGFLEIIFIFQKCATSKLLSYLHQTLPVQGKITSKIESRDTE